MIVLYIILGIVGAFLLMALVNGKTMTVECTTTINKSAAEVFEYVKLLDNHRNFNMWVIKFIGIAHIPKHLSLKEKTWKKSLRY